MIDAAECQLGALAFAIFTAGINGEPVNLEHVVKRYV
jgi:hypothetical protein